MNLSTDGMCFFFSRRSLKTEHARAVRRGRETKSSCTFITGYERDNETDLDFAQARYFDSGFGRYTGPDSFGGSGFVSVPQSWNRYVYCLNRPFVFTDPSGFIWLTKNNQDFVWVDDKDYEKNRKQYEDEGYMYANGATVHVTYQQGLSNNIIGKWVVLNNDRSVTPVSAPTIPTAVDEYSETEINNPITIIPGTVDPGYDRGSPTEGPSGGSRIFHRNDGGFTERFYDTDGRAMVDIDHGHDHGAGDPHVHWWDWTGQTPKRGEGQPIPETWERGMWDDGTPYYEPVTPGVLPWFAPGIPARPVPVRPVPVRPSIPLRTILEPVFVP